MAAALPPPRDPSHVQVTTGMDQRALAHVYAAVWTGSYEKWADRKEAGTVAAEAVRDFRALLVSPRDLGDS